MKLSILRRTPAAVRRPSIVTAFVTLACLLGSFVTAQATTFTVTSSHNLVWTTNTYQPVLVKKSGTDSLLITTTISGSSNFRLDNSPEYLWWPDAAHDSSWSADSVKYFYIYFSSVHNDTSYATVVLHSGTKYDTINLIGYGTASTTTFDFSTSGPTLLNRGEDSISGPQSVASTVNWIANHQNTYIHINMVLSDSTYWKIRGAGSLNETLYANDSAPGDAFQIDWTPHGGVHHDSVTLYLTCSSPYSQSATIKYYALDTTTGVARPFDGPTFIATDAGTVSPGDTSCATFKLRNDRPRPITIDSIVPQTMYDWSPSGIPSTPFVLAAGDSAMFAGCFHPTTSDWGISSDYSIVVYYTDSAGHKSSTYARSSSSVPACVIAAQDSIFLDDVMTGGYVDGEATFVLRSGAIYRLGYSSLYDETTWRPDSIGTVTRLSPGLPDSVHTGDTVRLRFRVSPDHDGPFEASISISDSSLWDCSPSAQCYLRAVAASSDSLNLFPDQTELLTLRGTTSTTSRTFYFLNNSGSREFVTGVSLSTGAHFHITGYDPHSPWDTLANGARMGVTIQFDADTNGFYRDSLTIVTRGGLQAQTFNLQAIRTNGTSAGVEQVTIASPVTLSIVPNPAAGPVTISLAEARRSTLEIFDLLGQRIVAVPDARTYTWDPHALPNGTYVVRATGTDSNGSQFVISKRLEISR